MDWCSEVYLRTLKKRRINEHPFDQLTKISRLSFPTKVAEEKQKRPLPLTDTLHVHGEQPSADHCDFSHFAQKTETLDNYVHSQPVNKAVTKSIHSDFYIPDLNIKIPEIVKSNQPVSESVKSSHVVNIMHDVDTVKSQRSNQSSDQFNVVRTFPSEQAVSDNSHPLSKYRSCPECAAGQPGHIRHIGRWRLLDSV